MTFSSSRLPDSVTGRVRQPNRRLRIRRLLKGTALPQAQSPVPAISASKAPLSPMLELEDVQNGITVLPVKSLAVTKALTGHAAMPHQIGYPMNTTS